MRDVDFCLGPLCYIILTQQADIVFTCIIFVIGLWVCVRQSFGCIWQVNHEALRV